jgi:hypothetical protein
MRPPFQERQEGCGFPSGDGIAVVSLIARKGDQRGDAESEEG